MLLTPALRNRLHLFHWHCFRLDRLKVLMMRTCPCTGGAHGTNNQNVAYQKVSGCPAHGMQPQDMATQTHTGAQQTSLTRGLWCTQAASISSKLIDAGTKRQAVQGFHHGVDVGAKLRPAELSHTRT